MPHTKTWSTIGYFASFIALGIANSALGPTLPYMAKNTGSSLGMIGTLFTARSLGSLLISGLSGRVYDRLPGHLVMGMMIIAVTGLTAMVPYVPIFWILVAVLFISGAAQGLLNIGPNTLMVWQYGLSVGPYMNGLHLFFGIGTVIAPLIVAQFITRANGLYWTYLVLAAIILPTALISILPSPSSEYHARNHLEGKPDLGLIILIALVFCCYGGAASAYSGWIYTYMTKLNLANAVDAAYLTSLFWIGLTLGRVLAIPLAIRYKPQSLLWADFIGAFVSLFVMIIWPESRIAILFTTVALGFSLASIYPTSMSMAGRMMQISGKITGYFSVGSSAGMMLLPWLVGVLFDSAGPQSMMIVIAVDLFLALGVLGLLGWRTYRIQYSREIQ